VASCSRTSVETQSGLTFAEFCQNERDTNDDLDVVLPSDGEMLLEHGDRVEVGGRAFEVAGFTEVSHFD
jgi:hypothetical protein